MIGTVEETTDPVFTTKLTRIDLVAPTTVEHDLDRTHYAANLVPAVQGARASETFEIPKDAPPTPGPLAQLGAGAGRRAHRRQLDARRPAAGLPLHALGRADLLAPGRLAGPRHERDRRGRSRDRARVGDSDRVDATVALAALAAQLERGRPRVHADARALLGRRHARGRDLVRLRRRGHDDPLRRRDLRAHAGGRDRLHGHLPRGRRHRRQRPRRHRRPGRPGSAPGGARRQRHESVRRDRRRRRGDRAADTRPGAAGVPGQAAPHRAPERLRRSRAVAAVGDAGRLDLPLDGELAHRLHDRGSARARGPHRRRARAAVRPAQPPPPRRLRELRARSELCVDRPPDHRLRAAHGVRGRRRVRGARPAASRPASRRNAWLLRPRELVLRRAARVERAARRGPARQRRARRDRGLLPRARRAARLGPLPETVSIPADRILRVDDDPSRPEDGSFRVLVEGGK